MTIIDIFNALVALEGPSWMMQQGRMDQAYGLMPALRMMAIASVWGAADDGSFVIYGDGGLARYNIDGQGNLRVHSSSVTPAKLAHCKTLGVLPT